MKPSLITKTIGLEFPNPVWLASGPWGSSGEKLKLVATKGQPGALVTKSIPWEPMCQASPRAAQNINHHMFYGVDKTEPYTAEEWFDEQFPIALQGGVALIANVNIGSKPVEQWCQVCRMAEQAGAQAVELGFAAPSHGIHFLEQPKNYGLSILDAVKQSISIPVLVKLPYLFPAPHIPELVGPLVEKGADALVTCGNVSATQIDIETQRHTIEARNRMGTFYGRLAKPVSLAMVRIIVSCFSIPVIASGGISRGEDVIEYVMMGASATQLALEAMLKGPQVFKIINEQIETWMLDHQVTDLASIQGLALRGAGGGPTGLSVYLHEGPFGKLPE